MIPNIQESRSLRKHAQESELFDNGLKATWSPQSKLPPQQQDNHSSTKARISLGQVSFLVGFPIITKTSWADGCFLQIVASNARVAFSSSNSGWFNISCFKLLQEKPIMTQTDLILHTSKQLMGNENQFSYMSISEQHVGLLVSQHLVTVQILKSLSSSANKGKSGPSTCTSVLPLKSWSVSRFTSFSFSSLNNGSHH